MKHTLKQSILNAIDSNPRKAQQVITENGYSSIGNFKRVLLDEDKEFSNFLAIVKIIQTLFPDNEQDLMKEYSKMVHPNKKTSRQMLEYLDLNYLRDEKEELIARMEAETDNKETLTWMNLYKIDHLSLTHQIEPTEALRQYHHTRTNSYETDIIKAVFIAYTFLDMKQYKQALLNVEGLEKSVGALQDDYIKQCYLSRIKLLQAECHSRNDNLETARILCEDVLDFCTIDSLKGSAYVQLANSYILTDFTKANECIMQGLYHPNIHQRTRLSLIRSSNFLHNVWNRKPLFLQYESEHYSDRNDIVFHLINQDKMEEALELLSENDLDSMTTNGKAFHYYLSGQILDSLDDYLTSIKYFRESGDTYFRQLPLVKLKSENINDSIISLLAQ